MHPHIHYTLSFLLIVVRAFTIGNSIRMSRQCMCRGDDHLAWKHPIFSEACKRLCIIGGYDRSY